MTASPGGTSSPPLPSRDAAFAPPDEGAALLPPFPPDAGLSGRGAQGRGRGRGTETRHVEKKETYVAGRKRGSTDGFGIALGGDGGALGEQDGRFEKRSRAIATDQPEQSPDILSPESHGFPPGAQADKVEI